MTEPGECIRCNCRSLGSETSVNRGKKNKIDFFLFCVIVVLFNGFETSWRQAARHYCSNKSRRLYIRHITLRYISSRSRYSCSRINRSASSSVTHRDEVNFQCQCHLIIILSADGLWRALIGTLDIRSDKLCIGLR